jgi:hypothetical protein
MKYDKVIIRKDNILVSEIEGGVQTINGIIIPDDDMKDRGIRPRWCKVADVGPDVVGIQPNDWVLVEHGRWTRGFNAEIGGKESTYRWLDYADIYLVQSEKPEGVQTL